MKKSHPLLLSLLSGLLLYAAWPMSPLTPLIFVAWVPLLWLQERGLSGKRFFGWTYLSMLTWNATTTWWIWNASPPGAAGAIVANSLLMCLPFAAGYFVKRRMGDRAGHIALVAFWLSFEYFHLRDWGLSWPWLTLGNVFAGHTGWVQWYAFTGVSGGGCWILVTNILVFQMLATKKWRVYSGWLAAVLLVPIGISIGLSARERHLAELPAEAGTPARNIVIVQPNIDPYKKLSTGSFDAMLQKLIRISESGLDSNTTLLIWPETALYMENHINEENMKGNYFLNPLWDFLRRHPHISLLTGVESYRMYKNGQQTTTARKVEGDLYVDDYNAAMVLDSTGPLAIYHKTMLVPGVETLPPFLHILDSWFEKFGGTSSGYTGQTARTVLPAAGQYHIAPAVCYESIYGEFMSRYVRNGADLIAVITNDGWWGNTPGYRQHENYARLRCIETRRWLVRSANTGVSCVIDPLGNIVELRSWDTEAFIRRTVPVESGLTFYVAFGDLVSWLAIAITILITGQLLWRGLKSFAKNKSRHG